MGTTCGCASLNSAQTPREAMPENNLPSTRRQSKCKFDDINPSQMHLPQLSEQDLNLLKNQISCRLNEFQKNNGAISKRLTSECSWSASKIEPNVTFSSEFTQKYGGKEENQQALMQLYLPLTDDNINLQIDQHSMASGSYTQKEQIQKQSCLLSQPSRILSHSIFTDRINAKNLFYQKYNYFGTIKLLEWNDQHRQSYHINESELIRRQAQSQNYKFLVLLRAILDYYDSHQLQLISYCKQPTGLKLYVNGKKRLFPLAVNQDNQPSLKQISESIISIIQQSQITQMVYHLTGWVPQLLSMAEIKNFQGIFERLSNNLQEGNTLVFFSRRNHQDHLQYVALKKVYLQLGEIVIHTGGQKLSIPQVLLQQKQLNSNELCLKIQTFSQLFDTIHLCWNPIIYELIIKREGFISKQKKIKNKYLLVIPPSSQDIQIRLFLQKHHNCYNKSSQKRIKLQVQLYQYEPLDELDDYVPIRSIQTESNITSDVFIFQSCSQKSQYLLTVQLYNQQILEQDLYYCITMLSFVQMHFDLLQQNPILKQISMEAPIQSAHMGYGINSPYFNRNIQFAIESQVDKQLTISVKASQVMKYEICLIPDNQGVQYLTKINLQNIINNSLISNQKNGNGNFSIKTTQNKYLLLINNYSQVQEIISINVTLHGKNGCDKDHVLKIRKIQQNNNVIFFQQIKWLPSHSGPRKRLKSNSINAFQPAQNFTQFFKNPVIDRFLTKGRYQFFIRNQTFREYFDSVETYEDKNMCQPPALSIALFQVQKTKKQYKIVIDDAFYVPFGIGFWSHQTQLQEGYYRMVCPKIQKSYSVGIFGIIKC